MAQDLGFDIAASPIATLTFGADIAAGASNTSTAVDLTGGAGTVVPGEVGIALTMAIGAGTPDGNQQYKLKALWSLDGVGFTDAEFGVNIDIGDVVASQTDTKHFTIPDTFKDPHGQRPIGWPSPADCHQRDQSV